MKKGRRAMNMTAVAITAIICLTIAYLSKNNKK